MSTATVGAGTNPQSAAIDPSGKYAYVANNGGNVSQYTVGTDGSLTPMSTAAVAAGFYAHDLRADPARHYGHDPHEVRPGWSHLSHRPGLSLSAGALPRTDCTAASST